VLTGPSLAKIAVAADVVVVAATAEAAMAVEEEVMAAVAEDTVEEEVMAAVAEDTVEAEVAVEEEIAPATNAVNQATSRAIALKVAAEVVATAEVVVVVAVAEVVDLAHAIVVARPVTFRVSAPKVTEVVVVAVEVADETTKPHITATVSNQHPSCAVDYSLFVYFNP